MTRDEVLARLHELQAAREAHRDYFYSEDFKRLGWKGLTGPAWPGEESAHVEADAMLLGLIGDDEIAHAFDALDKWYS